MLTVKDLHVHYGAIHAIKGISITVNDGEVVSLIGANGAGKTTILHTITGLKSATSGEIMYDTHNLRTADASKIITMGMAHVPEGRHVFQRMTVAENLDMGAYSLADKSQIEKNRERVYKSFPRLKERYKQVAGTLSGGEQQMLAIGRGLMAEPRLLILDEPSLGLSPLLVEEMFTLIGQLNREGLAVLLVEQNVGQSLEVAQRAYVLENGAVRFSGSAAELLASDVLRLAYLGV